MDTVEFLRRRIPPKEWGVKEPLEVLLPLPIIHAAADEIERLRASQFRWRLVEDGWPGSKGGREMGPNGCLVMEDSGLVYLDAHYVPSPKIKYWAHIPPLPEKSEEEKDEELWHRISPSLNCFGGEARAGFFAGLKAARSQQP